jgi:non-specific serine/threonine protein kinase
VWTTAAAALFLRVPAQTTPEQAVLDRLGGGKRLLLILDNCEQIIGEVASVSATVLHACPGVTVLATSRQPLQIAGEQVIAVPPLDIPALDTPPLEAFEATRRRVLPASAIQGAGAVALLVERARQAHMRFRLTDENAAPVARICRRLDGIPLAVELAASRLRALSVQALADQLEQSFRLLSGGDRTVPRQQTLQATLDWSYDLLTPQEQTLLCRLSVFAGGWTLEAAEAVCPDPLGDAVPPDQRHERERHERDGVVPVHSGRVLDLLTRLVDASLVVYEELPEGTARYRLLETLRQYARERLAERGEGEAAACRTAHRDYFLALAEEAEPHLISREQVTWLKRLESEHDNLRAALEWRGSEAIAGVAGEEGPAGAERVAATSCLRIAAALGQFWLQRSHLSEGRQQLARALALEAENDKGGGKASATRAKALFRAGVLAYGQGDYTSARGLFSEALTLYRILGDRAGIAEALRRLGNVARRQGDYASARVLHTEAVALKRELGDRLEIILALLNLGDVAEAQGDVAAARQLNEESLALRRELGDKSGIAVSLHHLAEIAKRQGNYASARALYAEAVALKRELGTRLGIAVSLHNMAHLALAQGDLTAARGMLSESLELYRKLGNRSGIVDSLEAVAILAGSQDRPDWATTLYGAARALREAIGAPPPPAESARQDEWVSQIRAVLGDVAFSRAWQLGRGLALDQAMDRAMEVCRYPDTEEDHGS